MGSGGRGRRRRRALGWAVGASAALGVLLAGGAACWGQGESGLAREAVVWEVADGVQGWEDGQTDGADRFFGAAQERMEDHGKVDLREALNAAGYRLVEQLWGQVRPAQAARSHAAAIEERQVRSEAAGKNFDPDPAYRSYRAAKRFYEEHEYLAWYGGEETGEGGVGNGAGAGLASGAVVESSEGTAAEASPGTAARAGSQSAAQAAAGSITQSPSARSQELLQSYIGTMERPLTGDTYAMEQLLDYDFLMKRFYNVHTSTTAGRNLMDAKSLLERDLTLEEDAPGPQILIYHTHSQEAFADSGPGETILEVGDYLTQLLEAEGYVVYHDRSVYDVQDGKLDRSRAYNYALAGIERILEENPTIEVVVDLHRDGVAEGTRLAAQVDGKPTAQIMFFNGLSQTPEGPIDYLENPYREDNLAFSLKLQLGANAYYPGFARKIYLKGLRYNQHLRPRSALVEVGAQTNTYEEARNAMEPLARLFDMVLQGG